MSVVVVKTRDASFRLSLRMSSGASPTTNTTSAQKAAAVELAQIAGLPPGWDVRSTTDWKLYFVDHDKQKNQWRHPVDKVRRNISRDLPTGWKKDRDSDGIRMYRHESGETMYMDPRIVVLFDENRIYLPASSGKAKPIRSTRRGRLSRTSATKVSVGNPTEKVPPVDGRRPPDDPDDLTSPMDDIFDRYSTGMQVAKHLAKPREGQCAVITGANSGIGFETARCLALNGIHVVMACRSVVSASDAAFRIRKMKDGCRIDVMELDLSSLQSVHRFATDFKQRGWPLSILICCASVMGLPYAENSDGVEMHFAINHLGHFYLTKLLTPTLCRSAPSRVIVLSSELHRIASLAGCSGTVDFDRYMPLPQSNYWPLTAYIQSKLCNLLFVKELRKRMERNAANVSVVAVHPGMTSFTALTRHSWALKAAYTLLRPFFKTVEQASATVVYCALNKNIADSDALYYTDCMQAEPAVEVTKSNLADRLWKLSEMLCNASLGKD
ncbi:WW domain-containing oxidoreductase-like [Sycon ciliatum]|uniref:WW domain-containing oxidoreductase-like n=1 Tax=Sycon ciliatum TaxID=27933 RepID=UPI0020AAA847|eukprot:scpid52603/ scgid9492/ WW domain-containing oxidoreductase